MPRKRDRSDELRMFDSLPDSAYVRHSTVQALFSIGHTTVWRWVQQGLLDRPVKMTPGHQGMTGFNVGKLRARLKKLEAGSMRDAA